MDKIVIEIGGAVYTLKPLLFDTEIDLKEYIRIDHSNIMGELLTMPLVLNQIANLKAEVDHQTSLQKIFVDTTRAEIENTYKASRAGLKTTLNDLDNYVSTHPIFIAEKEKFHNLQKQAAYMDSFYWSAKAKLDALETISSKISPDEFNLELLEKNINNVLVKKFNGKL